jgi:hypothetical protein
MKHPFPIKNGWLSQNIGIQQISATIRYVVVALKFKIWGLYHYGNLYKQLKIT